MKLTRIWHTVTKRHTWKVAPAETLPNGRTVGPWLYCPVCGTTRDLLAEPPADHPDSMTAELDPAHEEWLAVVDAELWEKEAA